jgi:uncharacterized membrane protein
MIVSSMQWMGRIGAAVAAASVAAVVAVSAGANAGVTPAAPARPVAGYTAGVTAPPVNGFILRDGRYTPVKIPRTLAHTAPNGIDPTGINDRGQIVGEYVDNRSVSRGYLLQPNGRFTRIDVPGSMGTNASKINNRGQIVGLYNDRSPDLGDRPDSVGPFSLRGFLREPDGRYIRIDFPGATSTQVLDINDRGQAVGEYIDQAGAFHGFMWERGRITTLDVPGAAGTSVFAINDHGQIAGVVGDGTNPPRGFLLDRDGRLAPFNLGSVFTFAAGVNNRGQVVGFFSSDPTGATVSAFQAARGAVTIVNRPGFDGTVLLDINNRGQIAGATLTNP